MKVRIERFRAVDEDLDSGARIVARFDCQIGPVRLYDCTLLSTPKGRRVRPPACATVSWGALTAIFHAARDELMQVKAS